MGCGLRTAIAAEAVPPSLVLKYLIWVALGLPSEIVHATTVPLRGAATRLRVLPTFTWKPVVRVTARHDVGQLGVVGGVVAGITPTSESVASAPMGSARVNAAPTRSAMSDVRSILGLERSILG